MNELIRITTNEQGSSVVSARELYEFLGLNKATFARWAKKNIVSNPYACEKEDWEHLNIMLRRGNGAEVQENDYALTFDFAERLSMLARTEKGEEIRRWFQSIKKQLLQQPTQPDALLLIAQMIQQQTQTLQQQTQLLMTNQQQVAQLRAEVDYIKATGQRPAKQPQLGERSPVTAINPPGQARQALVRRVNAYADLHNATTQDVWSYLYKRLFDVFGLDPRRLKLLPGESKLSALERYGYLDRLDSLIRAELDYTEE